MKKAVFGIIVTTRGFFNPELARRGRLRLLKKLHDKGYETVSLEPNGSETGLVETYADSIRCAELFRRILVTNKLNSYVRFAKANGITLVQLKTGKAKKGIYNIQHINSYHSQLKKFMRGFNGVSTKYLNNYLAWHNLVNYAKKNDAEKRDIFVRFVLNTVSTNTCRQLPARPPIPLAA